MKYWFPIIQDILHFFIVTGVIRFYATSDVTEIVQARYTDVFLLKRRLMDENKNTIQFINW